MLDVMAQQPGVLLDEFIIQVLSGANSANPHGSAGDKHLEAGDAVTIALSDTEAVLLLVELVRNPRSSSLELTRALRPKIPRICPALIDDLLCSWDLEQKKGASDLRSY